MYLIFLVLSVIQIPIAWLQVSPFIQTYLSKPAVVFNEAALNSYSEQIIRVDKDFEEALGYDAITGKFPEPNSYRTTDKFFIQEAKGKEIFIAIKQLHDWSETLPVADSRKAMFAKLFETDLLNGIKENNYQLWIDYRWKHVPAILARNLMEELKLRAKLLNSGSIGKIEDNTEPSFSLMTNYASMRVGDETTITTKGDSLVELMITRDGTPVNDFTLIPSGFVFKPSFAGKYQIKVNGKTKSEEMSVQVIPAGFPSKETLPFRVCYKGVEYSQHIPFKNKNMHLRCSADPNARLDAQSGILYFNPGKLGWCTLKVSQGEGVLFYDSVFVKTLPDPIVQVVGAGNNQLSLKKIIQNNLLLKATHPSFKDEVFEIKSFYIRTAGKQTGLRKQLGKQINLSEAEVDGLKYLIIYQVEVRAGNETKMLEQPIIIQII